MTQQWSNSDLPLGMECEVIFLDDIFNVSDELESKMSLSYFIWWIDEFLKDFSEGLDAIVRVMERSEVRNSYKYNKPLEFYVVRSHTGTYHPQYLGYSKWAVIRMLLEAEYDQEVFSYVYKLPESMQLEYLYPILQKRHWYIVPVTIQENFNDFDFI